MTHPLPKAPPRNKVKIDKSVLADSIEQRYEDEKYRKACHDMECVVTGYRMTEFSEDGVDPAHLRLNFFGKGVRPHDFHLLPLAHSEHRKQEVLSERGYWHRAVEQHPEVLANALKGWAVTKYLKYLLGSPDMSDLALVKKIKEARQRGWL